MKNNQEQQQHIKLDKDIEPVEISNLIQSVEKEADINMNLDSQEHNVEDFVSQSTMPSSMNKEKPEPENDTSDSKKSSFPFNTIEFVKFILFRVLNIIYNRFFDVVNDFTSVYNELTQKLK